MSTTEELPQEIAARLYMEAKGYLDARPFEQEKLEDQPCWYFYYDVPGEGEIELEIFFDRQLGEWSTTVTNFIPQPAQTA